MSRASIPDLLLEKLLNGELEPERASAIEQAMAQAEDDRLQVMRTENEEILVRYPAQRVATVVQARAEAGGERSGPAPWLVWSGVAVGLAAVAALSFWGISAAGLLGGDARSVGADGVAQVGESWADGGQGSVEALDPIWKEETRLKGMQPLLHVHRKGQGSAEKLESEAMARAGDVLQVSYVAAGRKYGAVVSFDGGGVITWHFPERVGGSTELSGRTGVVPLGHSYELDSAPAFERFVFIAGATPIDTTALDRDIRVMAKEQDAATRPVTELLADEQNLSYSNFVVRKNED